MDESHSDECVSQTKNTHDEMENTQETDVIRTDKEQEEEDVALQDQEDVDGDSDFDDEGLSNWPDELTLRMIELWKNTEYLYNSNLRGYHSKEKKEEGYAIIAEQLDCDGK